MYNEVLKLINKSESESTDEYGNPLETETYTEVLCNVASIGQKEFYQAQTVGVKPEIKAEIADYLDYDGQDEVILNGFRYKVLRTYRTQDNGLELTLYGGVRLEFTEVSN